MAKSDREFELPSRVDTYLAALNRLYEKRGERLLQEVIVNGVVTIQEGWDYDNWNGGTYGHAVTLTIPADIFLQVVDTKLDIQNRILKDLTQIIHGGRFERPMGVTVGCWGGWAGVGPRCAQRTPLPP